MLRALLRIMKRSGVFVGLFAFLTLGTAFPGSMGFHDHGAVTGHHHGAGVNAGVSHDLTPGSASDHAIAGDSCGGDCCAPGCCALIVVAVATFAPPTFEWGRITGVQDRRVDGLTPLTDDRPPRA